MKSDCNIIRDLLPLYVDGVCSNESRSAVDAHLESCTDCRGFLANLRSEEGLAPLRLEAEEVLHRQQRHFRRRSFTVGSVFAAVLLLPLLICLIVDLASGGISHGFYVLFASLLLAAALIVVPLAVPRYRLFWCCTSSLAALLFLLFVCSLGRGWFFIAASSVVFGVMVVFFPILLHFDPLKQIPKTVRLPLSLAVDVAFFAQMMLIIGVSRRSPDFRRYSFACSLPVILFLVLLTLLRRLPFGKSVRAGVCSLLCGGFIFVFRNLALLLLREPLQPVVFYPLCWNGYTLDGNIKWVILLLSAVLGLGMILYGNIRKERSE